MRNILFVLIAAVAGVGVAMSARHFFEPEKTASVSVPGQTEDMRAREPVPPIFPANPASYTTQPAAPVKVGVTHYEADATPSQPIYLRGYIVRGRIFNALLSDGRTLTERDGTVEAIERNGVLMKDGTFYAFRTVSESRGSIEGDTQIKGSGRAALAGSRIEGAGNVTGVATPPSESRTDFRG